MREGQPEGEDRPMAASTARAYLDLPADERFESRIPGVLKRHAEMVARAKGESLSEYVMAVLAERVADDIVSTQEILLIATEQVALLKLLTAPAVVTPQLAAASNSAKARFNYE